MTLHGLAQFCFVVVAFLVTAHVHVAILLWSALAEGLSPPVGSPEYGCDRVSTARLSSSCTSPLLADRLGADTTIAWLLQHSELFASSFSSLPG